MIKELRMCIAAIGILASGATAQATTIPTNSGPLNTNTTIGVTLNSNGGAAAVSFDLLGYASLDGDNFYKDVFSLVLNGTTILSGTYNLGGGGNSVTTTNTAGLLLTGVDPGTSVTWAGGTINFAGTLNLLNGLNSLVFAYDSPGGQFAGFQGLGDEGWGVGNLNVTVSAVPLPPAVFLLGSGLVGLASVRRRKQKAQG